MNRKIYLTFSVCLVLSILNGYFFNYVNTILQLDVNNDLVKQEVSFHFVTVVLIAPVLEALIFQYLPNVLLQNIGVENKVILIVLPSILFSLMHFYNWVYIIMAFNGGIILNSYYVFIKQKTGHPLAYVSLLHSLYNLYGFLFIM